MATALKGQDHDGLLDEETARHQAGDPPQSYTPKETQLAIFGRTGTVGEILLTVETAEALGYVPELRSTGGGAIEVYVRDVPSLIATLAGSLARSRRQKASARTRVGLLGANDPRWANVTDDTLVDWDGAECKFGELSQNEKMDVEIDEHGRLFGGNPL